MTIRGLFSRWALLVAVALLPVFCAPARGQEQDPDPNATRAYAFAVGLQSKQLHDVAEKRWQTFISEFPADPRQPNAHHYLGACQLQQKKYADAAGTFRVLLKRFPKFAALDAAQFNLGLALYNTALESKKADDFQAAAKEFGDLPGQFPQSKNAARAAYYEGECCYLAGNLKEAVRVYRQFVGKHKDDELLPHILYALGTTLQELGDHNEAAEAFQTFVKQFGDDSKADECRLRLGQALVKQGKHAGAAKLFSELASRKDFPLADYALLQQAECLFAQDQFASAGQIYERLPVQFPASKYLGYALLSAGKCWYLAEQYPQARKSLEQAADSKFAEAPEAAYWLGQALLMENRAKEAVSVFERALSNFPKSTFLGQIQFARINALFELPERRKETVSLYADFAQKNPQSDFAANAQYMAALAALKVDDTVAAQKYAEQFLATPVLAKHELAPKALFILGESCLSGSKSDATRADGHFRRLIADFPKHADVPKAQLRLGFALYLQKKNSESIDFLNQAVKTLPDPGLLAEALLLLGRNFTDLEKRTEAVAALRGALKAKANWERSDEVLLPLALNLRLQNNLNGAAVELKRLTSEFPKSALRPQALFQLAEIQQEQRDLDQAIASYGEVVAQHPKTEYAPLAQFGIGAVQFARKDYAKTVDALGTLLTQYPTSEVAARGKFVRGLAYQRLQKHEQAIGDLTEFLAAKPAPKDALDARYALGLCQAKLQKYDDAAATFATLLKENPDYERADAVAYEMAFALLEGKKTDQAATAFRDLAAKYPGSVYAPESWYRAGENLESSRKFTEAEQAFRAGLAKVKEAGLQEKLQYKLSWVLYQLEKYPESGTILAEQLKLHPKGELAADATYLAGECLFRSKNFDEAATYFDRIAKGKSPKYLARALYRSGACGANRKVPEWAESQRAYQNLIDQFPKFELISEARYGLGWALQNQKKFNEARAIYEQITKETNTETAARSRFMIGELAFAEKNYKQAIEHFLEAALAYPYDEWKAQGFLEAGRCFIELRQEKQAREHLQTVIQKFPNHPCARDAARLIAELGK